MTPGGLAFIHRDLIVTLAARHKLPAAYFSKPFVAAGGLASYGPDNVDQYRRAAAYIVQALVRSSRWNSGPSKGQRPVGSECCVTPGNSGCEAYTAIAWGVGLSLERSDIAGAESFHSLEGNMCGTVLSPCRGQRPHHVQTDRVGSWEIPCLTASR